ncbi:hypothetical protein FBY14_12446 [Azospirillum brasilense]|nr:hypothetical protein FBY14_12446 [Azospirillum brasilense]
MKRTLAIAVLSALSASPAAATDATITELVALRDVTIRSSTVHLPVTRHADGLLCVAYVSATSIDTEAQTTKVTTSRVCGVPMAAQPAPDGWPLASVTEYPEGLRAIRPFLSDDGAMVELLTIEQRAGSRTAVVPAR